MKTSTRIILAAALLALGLGTRATPALAAGGCPSIQAIGNFLPSNLVSGAFTISTVTNPNDTTTYVFDSLVNENPSDGVPGLIAYCVYPANPPGNPNSATAQATGADGSFFQTSFGAIQGFFAFTRNTGNPSNIPLDGTTGITIGTATWTGGAPSAQTILLHINDGAECASLYGGTSSTCFVQPSGSTTTKLCNGNPACKQVIIDEALTTSPLTVPAFTYLHIRYLYVMVNQPTNTVLMTFLPPTPKTQDINSGGAKDYFGCEQIPDPASTPGGGGTFANYQSTGFTLNLTVAKATATCDQSRFIFTAPTPIVLAPGQSRTFTIDMVTRKNKSNKYEYTSVGPHFLNSGFTVKWFQSDDGLLHSFTTGSITVNAVNP
ncbi:MAG: hypothetical protein HY257_11430 [Chloroflexi bacterium]|nr:hypothetical protein [Chloroflexota bacterium]